MRGGTRAALVLVAVAAGVVIGRSGWQSSAMASSGPSRAEPPAAKVAWCDIYTIADKLMVTERFSADLNEEKKKVEAELESLKSELEQMAGKLQGMSPQDEEAQKFYKEFQAKQQAAQRRQAEINRDMEKKFGMKYVEAYKAVKQSAEGVAKELGYTHVIASKQKDEIPADNLQQVIQAVLARPIVVSPDGSDITEDVMKDLHLGT